MTILRIFMINFINATKISTLSFQMYFGLFRYDFLLLKYINLKIALCLCSTCIYMYFKKYLKNEKLYQKK